MAINEAAALGDAIKAAALRGKSLLVEASVQVREDGTTPVVILNSDDAVKIIDAQAPRMVYLVEQVFDFAGESNATAVCPIRQANRRRNRKFHG